MDVNRTEIENIPSLIWGKKSDNIIIAAHGSHSSKEDDCIRILAEEAVKKGYQVISFDFPCHGERANKKEQIMPDKCVCELSAIYSFAKSRARNISLFGCSMGAYFELLAFADKDIDRAWFLSPVTDMERIIHNIMALCKVTETELREKVTIENDMETLYYPYYEYVISNPIKRWEHETFILRGENDSLCEYSFVKSFSERFGCELTQEKGAEHWFHTKSELEFFRNWINKRL